MPGEQSVRSDEASKFRKILEKSSTDSSFSPRTELLSDADSHKGRSKPRGTSSHKRHRSRPHKERGLDSTTDTTLLQARQLTRLLAHDEFEVVGLRKVLLQTSERLDQESRRATEAETRAREAEASILALQAARHAAQVDARREQEALKAYQAQLEVARHEILRAQKELDSLATEKERAEEEAARERSKSRAITMKIEIQQAREQGREEGWNLGAQQAYKELGLFDNASVSSRSSVAPPLTSVGQQPLVTSMSSMGSRSVAPLPAPTTMRTPDNASRDRSGATSTHTATPHASHKRSGSLAQSVRPRIRVNSDPKPPQSNPDVASTRSVRNSIRVDTTTRPTSPRLSPAASQGRISPLPIQKRPSTPRLGTNSPLPDGYIPLQENGLVSLPPPHDLQHTPTSPHSPALPLPPVLGNEFPQSLQAPETTGNAAPTITVQEPTPPEPLMTMPEPDPAPAPPSVITESNVKPSKVLARDFATRGESPPLPPLPAPGSDRPNKGKQRQRTGPPRAGTGLHAPGRSSPSDTSTEFSQFEIVEQPERVRVLGMGRSNGSQLSVIMEGGSTSAESPELERFATPQIKIPPMSRDVTKEAPASQGILNDPREYAEFSESPLSPKELAHRRIIAEQLRFSPSGENRNTARTIRDDVSIRSSTTKDSAPRRRPNPKMPERLAASRDVEMLEKQAEMYDAFGTGRDFPTFDSQSSPEENAISTRTPEFRGHRRAASASTVPGITIQPPSRPASSGSKVSLGSNRVSPAQRDVPPATPSRRHSMQGSPLSPSRVPLPQTTGQVPMSLGTPHPADANLPPGFVPSQGLPMTPSRVPLPHTSGQMPMSLDTPRATQFSLPPGFVPVQGPPEVLEAFSSAAAPRTPGMSASGLPSKTPYLGTNTLPSQGGPPGFSGHTPSRIPLPLSTAQTIARLPDISSGPRGSAYTTYHELPRTSGIGLYEVGPPPSSIKYPMTPARMPLPDSVVGSPYGSAAHMSTTGWGDSNGISARPTTPALGRPTSLYAGDGDIKKKVSSTSLASAYKKFDPSTYVDPAYLASGSTTALPNPATHDRHAHSRPGSLRSVKSNKSKYAATIETASDEDDPPRSKA